jgi:hypothetical protein
MEYKTMAKQQTAVEWLIKEIDSIYPYIDIFWREVTIIKAKQMEKEQIVSAWDISRRDIDWQANGEQYYNEIYNTNQ